MQLAFFLISAGFLGVGALGMLTRSWLQKKTALVWMFSAILVADIVGTVLVLIGMARG